MPDYDHLYHVDPNGDPDFKKYNEKTGGKGFDAELMEEKKAIREGNPNEPKDPPSPKGDENKRNNW